VALAVGVAVVANCLGDDDYEMAAQFQGELDELSAELANQGVNWVEPRGTLVPPRRANYGIFPYSSLHCLRRVLALIADDKPVTPLHGAELSPADEAQVEKMTQEAESHLLCHSDYEGYYVPVDLDMPVLLPEASSTIGGGMVGSSQGLLAELRRCAPALGIRLEDDGSLADAEAGRVFELPEYGQFFNESVAWLTLHEACVASIAGGHAIVFA